jgi:hypothetical protein
MSSLYAESPVSLFSGFVTKFFADQDTPRPFRPRRSLSGFRSDRASRLELAPSIATSRAAVQRAAQGPETLVLIEDHPGMDQS